MYSHWSLLCSIAWTNKSLYFLRVHLCFQQHLQSQSLWLFKWDISFNHHVGVNEPFPEISLRSAHLLRRLNTEICIAPNSHIEHLMGSERSFVTVRRIDGVKIAPWPSPCTHEEQSQMTEHRTTLDRNDFNHFFPTCLSSSWTAEPHKYILRFNYRSFPFIKGQPVIQYYSPMSPICTNSCIYVCFWLSFQSYIQRIIAFVAYANIVRINRNRA